MENIIEQVRAYFKELLFFFNDTATTEIYTLSLHDARPICHTQFPIFGLQTSKSLVYITNLTYIFTDGKYPWEIGRAHV